MKPSKILEHKLPPMKHQADMLDNVHNKKAYALFWEMGAGKTYGEILRYRWHCTTQGRLIKWLIVCPLIVMENWKRELAKFSNIDAKHIQIVNGINHKSKAKKKTSSMKVKLKQFNTPGKTIFITNTETLQGLQQKKIGGRKQLVKKEVLNVMLGMYFEYITVDESHRFKSPTGIRAKTLHILGDAMSVKYKGILTGTPILNDPADIWSQFRFLAPRIFDKNFFSFRKTYFVDKNSGMPTNVYFPDWQINPGMVEGLKTAIASISNRVLKEDVLDDLPKKADHIVDIELSPEQRRLYDDMSTEMVTVLKNNQKVKIAPNTLDESLIEQLEDMGLNTSKVMSVDLAIVKGLRLQQIVSGIFTDDATGKTHPIKNNADIVLENMLHDFIRNKDEENNKIIIWCVFKDSYKIIAKVCEKVLWEHQTYTFLTGQQTYEEKIENMDRFNDDKNCVVIIANQGAGGTGINLVGANKAIYYSRDFSLEKDLQSDSRNHRGGQIRECARYDFVRRGTIDEEAMNALAKKRNTARDILDVRSSSIFQDMNLKELFLWNKD